MRSYEEIDQLAFEMSGMDRPTWSAEDEATRCAWKLLVVNPTTLQISITRKWDDKYKIVYQDGRSILETETLLTADETAKRVREAMTFMGVTPSLE